MRWAAFQGADGGERLGVLLGESLHALEPGLALMDLLGDDGTRLREAGERATSDPAAAFALDDGRLLPPIGRPPPVRDFYAFEQHVKTARQRRGLPMHPDWYELPVFYFSNPAAVIGP